MSDVVVAPSPVSRSPGIRAFTRETWVERAARFLSGEPIEELF